MTADVPSRAAPFVVVAAAAFGALSLVVVELSVFAAVAVFLAALALPGKDAPGRKALVAALVVGGLAAAGGLVRFAADKVLNRVVVAGEAAAVDAAVSKLRAIVDAQDKARAKALHDPDGDGVGSALLLGELARAAPVRGGAPLAEPLLAPRFAPTSSGAACVAGVCYVVWLPTADGATAIPGAAVDDEAAERRFFAYAWPDAGRGGDGVVFVDAYERILVGSGPWRGANDPPPADAVARGTWTPWKGKRARDKLVGDR